MGNQAISMLLQQIAACQNDRPWGMPGRFYTDPDWFAHECDTVLRHGWHALGRADEIPEPGDYFCATILNEPLIAVRGEDGEVRVLSNVCRHRGMPLAEGRGKVKRFLCSYHAWAYGLDGVLLRAARMQNADFDARTCRLAGFEVRLWNGMIYTSVADDPPPFEAPELDALLAPYEPGNFHLVHVAEEEWKCNWKSLVENFMEGYHLSVVHPETLHGYTPTGMAKKGPSGAGFTTYLANYPDSAETRGQGAPGLSEAERRRSTLFARFPTQVASQAATLLVTLSIFPRAADRIWVKWSMAAYGDELDEDTIAQRIALWEDVNREDREKLEKMQTALGSKHAIGGPLAGEDYEGTVRDFLNWLAVEDRTAVKLTDGAR
ncbi:aromatic ring-hydroxylating dioxygenase subunit alpha [Alisedimentitalea sp. MJ-SS2]|uniref:aromatic ring-hydroxylating oxygenase subunit alpha n=1 Tax=Aliisedimentitalea sp. MJ-SS2 TaxID=3049795 RepID=UPI00290C6927|nr:aromatic ring-hydroxylating dioxygenase subunit alpha [Alisedimentitalea sp. MJ-SS2]MDU8928686.1 aromatic ring-hydroxylating dioxygenase subunit alpha [Alisedimentitalea sp. MJ-SS2]